MFDGLIYVKLKALSSGMHRIRTSQIDESNNLKKSYRDLSDGIARGSFGWNFVGRATESNEIRP